MPTAPCPPVAGGDVLDLAHLFCEARSHDDLRDRVHEALRPYGFKGFTLAVVRRVKSVYLHARVLSTWPQSIQSTFEQHQLFQADPSWSARARRASPSSGTSRSMTRATPPSAR